MRFNSGFKGLILHSFSSLSYDRSKASSKTSSLHSAIQSFLFQKRVSSHFGRRLSRKSDNVVVFPFAFHIAVQQPFKPLWSRLLLYDLEPSQASFALCFRSLLMTLLPASEEFLSKFPSSRYLSSLVPTLLTYPTWETLLVAMLPPT